VLAVAALAVGGCTSSPPPAAAGTAPPDDALSGVTVPDAFTAVVVRSVSEPTFPFLGTDGKYHVAYDLELTNAARVPATIDKLDVVDAHNPSSVVVSYSGTKLIDPGCNYGDCNRLRALPSSPTTSTTIPPQ
jgi:hypothetical protein